MVLKLKELESENNIFAKNGPKTQGTRKRK